MRQVGQGADTSRAGVAMAALLVGLSIMAIMMTVALPAWSHAVRREREIEMEWRGRQYQRAIRLFQRKFANTFPPTVDLLVEQKFLRKKYKDPITGSDFQVIPAGRPPNDPNSGGNRTEVPGLGIQGVVSKSNEKPIRRLNGASTYDSSFFLAIEGDPSRGSSTPTFGFGGPRPGLPPNTGGGGVSPPVVPSTLLRPPDSSTRFPNLPSAPPAVPLFGTPTQPPPQLQPPAVFPGMTPPGGPTPFPGGTPGFGGVGTRPPVAPPPTWRPR